MRVIVTGAGGFVGRGLLPVLAAAGHGGWAIGRKPPAALPHGWHSASRADVLSGKTAVTDVDAVIHLEVKHHVPRPTADDIREFGEVNVEGTRQWLAWSAGHRVRRFIFVSSVKASTPGDPEGAACCPEAIDSHYGRSKAAAEAAVRRWATEECGRTAIALRSAPVYGPGNEANFADFARQVIAGRPCVVGAGDALKSIVSRGNLAAAIEFGLSLETVGFEVYNISDPEELTLGQLASMIAELAAAPSPRRVPRTFAVMVARFGDLLTRVTGREFTLTTSRLKQMLSDSVFPCEKLPAAGFRHPQTTRQGLAEMLRWMAGDGRLRHAPLPSNAGVQSAAGQSPAVQKT